MLRKVVAAVSAGVLALTLTACGGGSGSGGSSAASGGKQMKLSLNQTEQHPSYVALNNMGKALDTATSGKYKIQVYPNETLGKQAEAIGLVKAGTIDLAIVSGTQLENLNKDFTVLNLPNLFTSSEQQLSVINNPEITGKLFSSLEANESIKVVGGLTQGTRSMYLKSGPINSPADMAGKKIRVQESELMTEMVKAMGASPTVMAYGEVYTGLQSGTIDGAENNEVSFYTAKHYEVAPYYSYTRHLVGVDYLIINAKTYASMSDTDRAAFDAAWKACYEEHLGLWTTETQKAVDATKAGGATFTEVDPAMFAGALDGLAAKFVTTDTQKALYESVKAAAK